MSVVTVMGCRLELRDCGDSALRVTVRGDDADAAWRVAHGLATLFHARRPDGVRGTVPTYDAVLVEFDCLRTDHAAVRLAVAELAEHLNEVASREPRTFQIPVCYERGPDLAATASHLGVSTDEIIAIHTARPLLMRCFGSPAGAPMLDGPAFGQPIPRLASPRAHVPAGAVAVAGRQAVVSARPAPGGWQVLGFTPLTLVDPAREPLSAYWPGDYFQFFPIADGAFDAHVGSLT